MTQTSKEKTEREAAFERMKAIYDDDQLMSPGSRAELRRAPTPEALLLQPASYRLTGGAYWDGWQRMAFILPHVKKVSTDEKPVGRSFAEADSGKAFDVDNKKDGAVRESCCSSTQAAASAWLADREPPLRSQARYQPR